MTSCSGQVVGFYHRTLQESPDALGYLARRRSTIPRRSRSFRLGFADRTLGCGCRTSAARKGPRCGPGCSAWACFAPRGHEHFVGSLVIPVFDEHGHVTEIYGRKIRDDLRPGTPAHLYLPGPHRGVWNLAAIAASDESSCASR